ncbi:MAG: hypothetical protein GY906_40375 [bacterium]|nr:hypothetical protein [bacterium]
MQHSSLGSVAARSSSLLEAGTADIIADYVEGQLNSDGGFRGRSNESDVYYTLFGIECLAALGRVLPVNTAKSFLAAFGDGDDLDLVHLSCLARCLSRCFGETEAAARQSLFLRYDEFRDPDGGYRLNPQAQHASIYAGYLVAVAHEASGLPVPDAAGIVKSIGQLRAEDGGFSDLPNAVEGTTTVTAAAVVLLAGLADHVDGEATRWLRARRSAFGGFVAGPRVPVPDLLSTATALHALTVTGALPSQGLKDIAEFIEGSWQPCGGFSAHPMDVSPDCEFTYYALLGLGALAEAA